MALLQGYWNNGDEYGEEEWSEYYDHLILDGVAMEKDGSLGMKVSARGMSIVIAKGYAIVRSQFLKNPEDKILTATADPNYAKFYRVVIRMDRGAKDISIKLKEGTTGTNPQPPALIRTDTVYEVSLARVRVGPGGGCVVYDERFDETVCGIVQMRSPTGLKELMDEYNAELKQLVEESAARIAAAEITNQEVFDTWFATLQSTGWPILYVQPDFPTGWPENALWIKTKPRT